MGNTRPRSPVSMVSHARRKLLRSAVAGFATGVGAAICGPAIAAPTKPSKRTEIVLGQTAVLSGQLGSSLSVLAAGASLVFDQVNRQGGVHGRPIRLVSLDDQLQPQLAMANYRKLLDEENPLAFFGCVGSATTAASAQLLKESGVPSFGGFAVSDAVRESVKGVSYFVRAGYNREAEVIMAQLKTLGISRVAWVVIANPGGDEVLTHVRGIARTRYPSVEVTATEKLALDGSNLADVAGKIAASRPQAVAMFLGGVQPANVIKAVRATGAQPSFYGMSIVPGEIVADLIKEEARGLVIAQTMPYPWSENDNLPKQFRKDAEAAKIRVSYLSFEGFMNARILVDVLTKAGPNADSKKVHATLRNFRGRYAGMDVAFAPDEISGSKFVELVQLTGAGRFLR